MAQTTHSQNTDNSDKEPRKNGFFDNVSFAAVISSALAAATSLFLSTKIGLAGSLIGAAVAAGASSLAMQVYQSILSKSAEKLHDLSSDNDEASSNEQDGQTSSVARGTDSTTVHPYSSSLADTTTPYTTSASGTRIAPEQLRKAATSHQSHSSSKRAIIIALVAAFVALGITALVISFATAGQGIGSTTTFSSSAQQTTTKNSAEETPSSPTNSSTESNSTTEKNNSTVNSNTSSSATNSGSTATNTSTPSDTTNSSSTSNSSSSSPSSNSSSTNSSSSTETNTSSSSNTSESTSGGSRANGAASNSSSTTSNTSSTESSSTNTQQSN